MVRLLVLALLLATRTVAAEQPWLTVDARADACIAADELEREVGKLLAGERPAGVSVVAAADAAGWTLELRHADGQRALRVLKELPAACDARRRTLALTIALALEHALAATIQPAPRMLAWALGVSVGGSVGELRSPVPLAGVEARLERGVWVPLELLASIDLAAARDDFAGATLITRQLTTTLGTCVGGARTSWRLDGCLGLELGATFGQAKRVPGGSRELAGSGACSVGVAGRWAPRSRLALTARVDGFVRFWVPTFRVLDAEGGVFAEQSLPAAGVRLRLGIAWLSR
ncbi:MAG: hypothetical protein ABW352_05050 [Polyangiales bacterium]